MASNRQNGMLLRENDKCESNLKRNINTTDRNEDELHLHTKETSNSWYWGKKIGLFLLFPSLLLSGKFYSCISYCSCKLAVSPIGIDVFQLNNRLCYIFTVSSQVKASLPTNLFSQVEVFLLRFLCRIPSSLHALVWTPILSSIFIRIAVYLFLKNTEYLLVSLVL